MLAYGGDHTEEALSLRPAQQAGLILAEEEYGDAGEICGDCLACRGRLAMMYRSDYFGD